MRKEKERLINADFIRTKLSDEKLAEMSVQVDMLLDDPVNEQLLRDLIKSTEIVVADFRNKRPLTGFQTTAPFARIKAPIAATEAEWIKNHITIYFDSERFPSESFVMDVDFRLRLFACLEAENVASLMHGKIESLKIKTRMFVQNIQADGSREDIYTINLTVNADAIYRLAKDVTDGSQEAVKEFIRKAVS